MKLLQALRNEAQKIAAGIENSKLFEHMGDRGSFREAIIKDFLRPFLPECYGLSAGEVFAADGSQSAQVDIVVYDAVFSTVLFKNSPCMLFPAESVFGSIEVKSNLTTDEFRTACDNVASLKGCRGPNRMHCSSCHSFILTWTRGCSASGQQRGILTWDSYSGIEELQLRLSAKS